MPGKITIALAGNPNCGKTTIFNQITGARQHVGNYPGVTVEKREGGARRRGMDIHVVDLPGTYSLAAYSPEEVVARDFILAGRCDIVVNVIDASNLERNLYLTMQLLELGAPVVLALNMMDVAAKRGLKVDSRLLSRLLGIPIVSTVGHTGQGVEELLDVAMDAARDLAALKPMPVAYGREIEDEIASIQALMAKSGVATKEETPAGAGTGAAGGALYPGRWLAVKLLEEDREAVEFVTKAAPSAAEAILAAVAKSGEHIRSVAGDRAEIVLADRRYGLISGACQEAVVSTVESRHIFSDKIDQVVTNRALGIPILLGLMYVVFYLAFNLAGEPGRWIGTALGWMSAGLNRLLPADPLNPLSLHSLLSDGIIGGVGNVIVFLPNIAVLFLAIAALEDSGYMARAAFVMDHLMHKIGLHGKSFIPMILGFGCSVPAIMATRIIENRRGRLTTMMVIPLMSCGARVPVYALIIPAFFAVEKRAGVLWLVYVIGIALAIGIAKALTMTVFRGESHPLVMELPPYRMPTVKGLLIHSWEHSRLYLKKAATVILAASILLWFAANWPAPPREELAALPDAAAVHGAVLERSLVGRAGRAIEPVLRPLEFDWRVGTALIGASAAKEVFVAQMGIVYGVGESADTGSALQDSLRRDYSPLSGFSMLLYMLIASPCVATVAVTRKESGSWKWAAVQWIGLTVLGYAVALIVYQAGLLLRLG